MSFDSSDLQIAVMRNKVLSLREVSNDVIGHDLLRFHSDNMSSL